MHKDSIAPIKPRMALEARPKIHVRESWATIITDFCRNCDNPETKRIATTPGVSPSKHRRLAGRGLKPTHPRFAVTRFIAWDKQ
jgi:hypothetical protein